MPNFYGQYALSGSSSKTKPKSVERKIGTKEELVKKKQKKNNGKAKGVASLRF